VVRVPLRPGGVGAGSHKKKNGKGLWIMKFGSLFSGIGGLDLGLERAGMECVWQVEIDDYCKRVLEKHWPDVPRYGDVRHVTQLPYVDLICGGFPCPPVSLAASSKRKFEDDERWLWDDFFRIICEVEPRWVLVENVPGLLSARDGKLFGGILGDLASVGFDAEWRVLSAKEFGAWHLRKRVFIVAYAKSIGQLRRDVQATLLAGGIQKEGARRRCTTWRSTPITGKSGRVFPIPGPDIFRVADGFPTDVDKHRIKACGNAVVPQVAEWIGERIIDFDKVYLANER